jgi:transcriptional regulator with XRE-family HTH domain
VRQRKLLTQAELAQQSGVTEVTINRLENGQHQARYSTIKRLAEALGVDPQELLTGEGSARAA